MTQTNLIKAVVGSRRKICNIFEKLLRKYDSGYALLEGEVGRERQRERIEEKEMEDYKNREMGGGKRTEREQVSKKIFHALKQIEILMKASITV